MVEASYQPQVAELTSSIIGRLSHHALVMPDQLALVTPSQNLTYGQLAELVQAQAEILKTNGICDTSVVGVRCHDDVAHMVLTLASVCVGATSCTLPTYEVESVQKGIIEQCGITQVLDESQCLAPSDLSSSSTHLLACQDEVALIFSTSGTSGEAKLVVHHDCDLVAQAHRHISGTHERFACLAAMEHNFAKRHRLYCLAVGGTNIFLGGDLNHLVDECQQMEANVLHVSAFQAQELLNLPNIESLVGIRLKLGGSHVPRLLRQQLRANITPNVQAGYGTTETGAIAFTDPDHTEQDESVGQPLPGLEVCVVDEQRKPLAEGERGELAIRGAGMFRGYFGKPELTTQRLSDDWFFTGDIGFIDEHKRIHLSGRLDDMFTFNSLNIYPQDIEAEICQYPDVVDAVVLPKKSSTHGNIPVALVVYDKNVRADVVALKKFVESRVGMRSPRQYTIVDEIPTTTTGKISRLQASKLTHEIEDIRRALIGLLQEIQIEKVKRSHITEFLEGKRDLSLRKFGLDSLARMNLLVAIETQYDVVIPPQDFHQIRTLGRLVSRIASYENDSGESFRLETSVDETESMGEDGPEPHIVGVFRRLCGYCKTVARLNQVLANLEYRTTPLEIETLYRFHISRKLLSQTTPEKFHRAVAVWLSGIKTLMDNSGVSVAQGFTFCKVAPSVAYFTSPRSTAKKLLIVFPPRNTPHLMMPNAVMLQHVDANQYDVLVITDRHLNEGSFNKRVGQLLQWLQSQDWYSGYKQVRTVGFSAGGFLAIALGYLLQAELACSINGRFHRKQNAFTNLDKILSTWRGIRKGYCEHVILSFASNLSRDRHFAKFFAKKCQGREVAVEVRGEKLPHLMLSRLAQRGELAAYFAKTVFAPREAQAKKSELISFPYSE